jgi:hypothetical protein
MADGFRLVPVQVEVLACDRQVRRYRQFFAAARSQQRAVVADAQPNAAPAVTPGRARCTPANLAEQGNFASPDTGMGLLHTHLMRIGQTNGILAGNVLTGANFN